ncbi:MAG TPA: sugar ABC transporter permease [Trueperaceae bacterium]|nr:sugar ABC transporter permease [Trueperaceae bacterium]
MEGSLPAATEDGVKGSAVRTRAPRKRPVSRLARAESRTAWLLLAPTFIILAVIAFYPFSRVLVSSFTNARFASAADTEYIGFRNYRSLLSMTIRELPPQLDESGQPIVENGVPRYESWVRVLPREPLRYRAVFEFSLLGKRYVLGAVTAPFVRAIWDTSVFTVIAVLLETILGMVIALALNAEFRGRGMMRAAMLVPWAVITAVSARIWEWMLQPTRAGLFNTIGSMLGISDGRTDYFGNAALQLPSMIAMDVWKTTPFMALLLLAGLATIPSELYEAAEVDGASKVRQFFSITLPLLSPTLAVALIFRTLDSLRVFDIFQVVLGNRRFSMASYTQDLLINQRDMGMSSAASVVIFVIVAVFAVLYIRMLGQRSTE